jgi:thioesterase domain-containing protein
LDTHAPASGHRTTPEQPPIPLLAEFAADLCRAAGEDPAQWGEQLLGHDERGQQLLILEFLKRRRILSQDASLESVKALYARFQANSEAAEQYTPRPLEQRVALFAAVQGKGSRLAGDWQPWAGGGMDFQVVPGDHYSMLQPPHVSVLVEHLRATLDSPRQKISF